MGFDTLNFTSPWLLLALLALPILWWLLKLIPPRPQKTEFGGLYFVKKIQNDKKTSQDIPWWLLLLRVCIAGLLIFAFAAPYQQQSRYLQDLSSPFILIIDNGWAAAPAWEAIDNQASLLLNEKTAREINVVLLPSIQTGIGQERLTIRDRQKALREFKTLGAYPWRADYTKLTERILAFFDGQGFKQRPALFYLNDGLLSPEEKEMLDVLKGKTARLFFFENPQEKPLLSLHRSPNMMLENALITKQSNFKGKRFKILAYDSNNRLLDTQHVDNNPDQERQKVTLNMPLNVMRHMQRLSLADQPHAGATIWSVHNRTIKDIGIIADDSASDTSGQAADYFDPIFYLNKALSPFHDIRTGPAENLIDSNIDILIMTNSTSLNKAILPNLKTWISEGGVLIRFADQALADGRYKELSPVELRQSGRNFGSAFSWQTPQKLASFPANSPFTTLDVPDDVTVSKQVLAVPSLEVEQYTVASLEDGTPLVTLRSEGLGWLALFHTGATPEWSNLVLSSLFIKQLNELIELHQKTRADNNQDLDAQLYTISQRMNASGQLIPPKGYEKPLKRPLDNRFSPDDLIPPGLYQNGDVLYNLNWGPHAAQDLTRSDAQPNIGIPMDYSRDNIFDFKPLLLLIALILFVADALWFLFSNYQWRGKKTLSQFAIITFLAGFLIMNPSASHAQNNEASLKETTQAVYLAYVKTGNTALDRLSEQALTSLMKETLARTSADLGGVVGINILHDPLYPYPLIYWPLSDSMPLYPAILPSKTTAKIKSYFNRGGTLLIDTRDQYLQAENAAYSGSHAILQRLFSNLEIPPLQRLPQDHVLARTFYLLKDFPGLYEKGSLWVALGEDTVNDGVSPLLIGSNDWISAWALDKNGVPVVPLGEQSEMQREMSFRFGINLILYALTGNYKDDQMHVPFILERLGN